MADENETAEGAFRLPLPPPPPGAGDVVYFFEPAPRPRAGDGDAEDILLRKVPRPLGQRFRAAAGARGFTHAQYLAALVGLHEAMRGLADAGEDERVAAELERLGLKTVSV